MTEECCCATSMSDKTDFQTKNTAGHSMVSQLQTGQFIKKTNNPEVNTLNDNPLRYADWIFTEPKGELDKPPKVEILILFSVPDTIYNESISTYYHK